MSDKKNTAGAAGTDKVMTKYDLKMQKRREEAIKAKKEERKGIIIGVTLLVALAAFVLSFPIRSYLAVNGAYIKVGGEKITQIEFDYQYQSTKNDYLNTYGSYMSMFGYTDLSTLEYQMYSDTLTFKDMFEEMAVDSLVNSKGLLERAKAEGFAYDTAEDLAEMKSGLEEAAKEAGLTVDGYLQTYYSPLATWSRMVPIFEEDLYLSAYYSKLVEDYAPSEEEIQAEYEANVGTYDSIDYHYSIVKAELPTTAPDGTVEKDEEGNEIPYEPTEEEIAEAMKAAKKEAEELEPHITAEGTEMIGIRRTSVNSKIVEYLFDDARKAGDTTIIEDVDNNRYFVVSFEKRYRDEAPTYKLRAILSAETEAQTILDEWKAGEATEDTFAELAAKYDENGAAAAGGLYNGVKASALGSDVESWLTEEGRAEGDTTAITAESGTNYVLYYIGTAEPLWKQEAENTLLTADLSVVMEEAMEGIEVEDPKKKLNYLYVEETAEPSEEAAESSEEASSEEESTEAADAGSTAE